MNILLVNNSLKSHALLKHVAGHGSYNVHLNTADMSNEQVKNMQDWCRPYGYPVTVVRDDMLYSEDDTVTVGDNNLFVGASANKNNPLETFSCKSIQRLALASRIEKQSIRVAYVGAMPHNHT
tara:strand:+ start:584 stop:952 length:369 start_codon:yes stop_codon:yes gene_type:complete